MDGTGLAEVVGIGQRLLLNKFFTISMFYLQIYDYFLTLGDEINYGWSGRRSWVFALFIANRYIPLLHVLYRVFTMFHFTRLFCRDIMWETTLYVTAIVVIAQMTMCIRVYAVTRRNKLLCGVLLVVIAVQLSTGINFAIAYGTGPIQPPSEVDLDVYNACIPQEKRPAELAFNGVSVVSDLFTFLIILVTIRGPRTSRFPGVPSILDAILRDATVYFLLMTIAQLLLFASTLFAPVQTRTLPGIMHATFLPIMVSRLMFSLRKNAARQAEPWNFSTMGGSRVSGLPEVGALHFAHRFDVSHETSGALAPPDGEVIELGFQLPRDSRSQ